MNFNKHLHATDLARLRKLAQRMDSAFRVPGIGIRVGFDSVLGLVPVVGDALTLLPSVFILRESLRMGASKTIMAQMGVNVGIDLAIGAIPLVGDVFDIGWRSNTRNVDLLHSHLAKTGTLDVSHDTALATET